MYSLAYPEVVSFPLNYASALVLPLQGWWNFVVYVTTSLPATKALLRKIFYLFLRREPVPKTHIVKGVRTYSKSSGVNGEMDTTSGTDSCGDSMKGFARVSQNYMPMSPKQYPLSP